MSRLFFFSCAVCFGDPASPLSKGVFAGVLLLIGVVGFVLGGVALTAFRWARREKELQESGQ